jgi:long-chain acyl-CoA synthetase
MDGVRRGPADRLAVVLAGTGTSWTHSQLEDRGRRLAAGLLAEGLVPGDVVAVLGGSNLAAFEVLEAVEHAGLTLAALDHTMGLEQLAYVVNDSAARAVFFGPDTEQLAGSLRRLTPDVQLHVALDGGFDGCIDHAQLLVEPAEVRGAEGRGAQLRYSSGGRGRPRPSSVQRPSRAAVARVLAALAPHHTVTAETVLLAGGTLADPIGWQLSTAVLDAGGTVVALDGGDAMETLAAISAHRVTLVSLPAPSLIGLLRVPEAVRGRQDLTSVGAVVHSGARMPVVAKRRLIDLFGPVVHEFYASAELGALSFISAQEWLEHPGSVGRSLLGAAYAAGPEGDLPAGETGVVHFGPAQVPGPRVAEQVPAPRSRVTLGDRGRVDADGYVILAGGRELEELLCLHPKVADVAAMTGADLLDVVLVQPAAGVAPDVTLERELVAYLRPRVSSPEALGGLRFVSRIPRTMTGGLATGRAHLSLAEHSLA